MSALAIDGEPTLPERPRTRADCVDGPRPCPWADCRHALNPTISGGPTCSLDIADEGSHTLEQVAQLLGLSPARVQQVTMTAIGKLRAALPELPPRVIRLTPRKRRPARVVFAPMPKRPRARFPNGLVLEVAGATHAHPATIRKVLSGRPVRGSVGIRVLEELQRRGIVPGAPAR